MKLRSREPDPMLRRFQRNQVLATLAMAAAAVVWRFDFALAVVGGGALMTTSYWAIKGGVDALLPEEARRAPAVASGAGPEPERPESRARTGGWRLLLVAKFAGRYALLALAAYVMLVCLHAHPVGLLVGATSTVVAAALEAGRVVRAWSRHAQSR